MKYLLALLLSTSAMADSITVAWDANPASDNVTGYRIYQGIATRDYNKVLSTDKPDQLQMDLPDLDAGVKYFIAATAFNAAGMESEFSDELEYTAIETMANMPVLRVIYPDMLEITGGNFGQGYMIESSINLKDWREVAKYQSTAPLPTVRIPWVMAPVRRMFFRVRPLVVKK